MIERISVQNFRCLQHFELTMPQNSALMTLGLNGVGKTTFLQVLEIFQRIGAGESDVGKLFSVADFSFGDSKDKVIRLGLDLVASGKRFQYGLALELPDRFNRLSVFEEHLECNGIRLYSRDRETVFASGAKQGASCFRLDWHRIALPLTQDGIDGAAVSDFREALCRLVVIAPMPISIKDSPGRQGKWLESDTSNFVDWLAEFLLSDPRSYSLILARLQDSIFSDLESFAFTRASEDTPRVLSFVFNQEGHPVHAVSLSMLSDGEKCELIAAVLSVKMELGVCDFCYWDEPENYLAVSEVKLVLGTLLSTAQKSGAQFLFSSHSLQTLGLVPDEQVKVFMRDSHLEPTYLRDLIALVPDQTQRKFLDLKLLTGSLYNEA